MHLRLTACAEVELNIIALHDMFLERPVLITPTHLQRQPCLSTLPNQT